jgi:gliding motility-associated-like protein
MKYVLIVIGVFLMNCSLYAQTISISNTTGEASIQKSTPQVPSIQTGERFSYTIDFQNLNNSNTLVITDALPAGLCFAASDVRANNAFVDFNGSSIPAPNSIPNLIDTSALPAVVFNIPNNLQSGSFTISVSFCAGETPNGFTATNTICADYTSNGNTESFCSPQGLTSTAQAVSPWGQISKEAILPAVSDAAGNTFVRNTNGIANYRIIVQKDPAFQGLTFGMLNLDNVTISEIASPACAVVSLVSGPGTYNSVTNQIELNSSLIGSDPFFTIEFIVEVDYSPCGTLTEGQSLSNRVELNGTPAGGTPQTNIANATTVVTATATLPAPNQTSAVTKLVNARNPVVGCQGRYEFQFFNSDNRAIAPYEAIDTIPAGLIPDSYEVIGDISTLSANRTFDVFINGTLDRSFTLPDDNFIRFPWNGASGDVIRIVAQNGTELYPGDFLIIGIYFTIDASLSPGDLVTNCVDFTADIILDRDPNVPTGNQSCIDLLIEAPSMDICVTKNVRIADTPDPFTTSITNIAPNDEVEFQICVQNNGSIDFNGRMEDVLNPRYEFISVDNSSMPLGVTFTQTGQNLVWDGLSIDQTCEIFSFDNGCAIQGTFFCTTVRARVRPFTAAGNIDNDARIIENSGTLLATSDFAKVNVIDSAVFVIRKEVSLDNINFQTTPLVVDPNCDDTIYYRIRVENIGNRDASQFILFDELPFPGDLFYPTNLNRNSTFSFTNIISSSSDFNTSYLNYNPSSNFTPDNFNCGATPAGSAFSASSRTVRFENSRTLTNTDVFEVLIEATLPSNNLTSSDMVINSAYIVNCAVPGSIIATSSITSPAIVDIQKTVEAGFDVSIGVCSTGTPINIFDLISGSPDAGGTFTPALASNGAVFDPAVDPAGVFTYTVTATPSCATDSSELTISISPQPDPGLDASITVCETDTVVNLFSSLNGTPDNGGSWSPVLTSGTGIFDPAIDPAGTYVYTIPAANFCPAVSAQVNVTVNAAANAGIDATVDLCSTGTPVDLNTLLLGNPDSGGTWTPSLISGTGIFEPSMDSAGVYTYTVSGNLPCPDDSAQLTMSITTSPDPGTDGTVDICANASPIDVFNSLNGTPQTGGTWTPALNSGSGVFDPAFDLSGNYTYTLAAVGSCPPSTSQVSVNITPAPDPGANGTITLCNSSLPLDLINALNGTPDTGGIWTPALASGTGLFDPATDTSGTYTYTVSRNACMDESATVQVNFNPDVIIATANNLEECDQVGGNDGLTSFDLTQEENTILNGLNPANHNLTYHATSNDAVNGSNALNTNYTNTSSTQTIFVRVENIATNCFATTSFNIIGLMLPEPQLLDEYEACLNEDGVPINPSRLPILDTELSNAIYTFAWLFEGNPINGATDSTYRADTVGNYSVVITNTTTGCINTDETRVVQEPYLVAQASLVTTQFDRDPVIEVTVLNDRGDTYLYRLDNGPWQTSNRFENPGNGIHTITVKGPNSCGIARDSILVLRYPRFFTPNSDSFNDYWQVENLTDLDGNKLYIFDRYGKLLKQLSLDGPGWDGTYNGNPMPSSDYWFTLEYVDPNTGEMAVLKSHFSLKR